MIGTCPGMGAKMIFRIKSNSCTNMWFKICYIDHIIGIFDNIIKFVFLILI